MKVIVPLAEGFEEIEFITVVDILRRAEIEVVTAGLKENPIEGAHRVLVMADVSMDEIEPGDFNGVILPGGFPGFRNLGEDERVLDLVREMDRAGKYVAAICGAPSVLVKAGVVEGKKATIHPAGRGDLRDDQYADDRVVVDGKLITSKAAGSALEFALKLVEVLAGEEKMWALKGEILAECEV